MTLYLSEKDARRLGLAQPRQKRGRATRPDIPAAGPSERVGLSGLIAGKDRAWSYTFSVANGHRLYIINGTQDTGWYATLEAACAAAKAMERDV